MRQPGPIPRHVKLSDLTTSIRARHSDDTTRLPPADNLLALLDYVAQHAGTLSEKDARHQERVEALYLSRLIERELVRLKLRIYRAGLADDMTARQLGRPEGLRSRPAISGRIKAFQERLDADKVHMSVTEYRQWQRASTPTVDQPKALFEVAQRLIAHIRDTTAPQVAIDQDVLDSAENITLTLQEATTYQAGSVRTQLKDLIEEIDAAAEEQGVAPASGSAARDLQAARDWLRNDRVRRTQ